MNHDHASAAAPILRYFADPMCSWCWGFAPTVQTLAGSPGTPPIELVMGGLRTGPTRPMTPELRARLQHHWHAVESASGQPFVDIRALPDDFVYDTEPACRAVRTLIALGSEALQALHAVQRAFYAEACDVTATVTLGAVAQTLGHDPAAFRARFDSPELRRATREDFERSREYGVSGFPTLILERGHRRQVVSIGYCNWDTLHGRLQRALQTNA